MVMTSPGSSPSGLPFMSTTSRIRLSLRAGISRVAVLWAALKAVGKANALVTKEFEVGRLLEISRLFTGPLGTTFSLPSSTETEPPTPSPELRKDCTCEASSSMVVEPFTVKVLLTGPLPPLPEIVSTSPGSIPRELPMLSCMPVRRASLVTAAYQGFP